VRVFRATCVCVALICAQPLWAQDREFNGPGGWQPIGLVPVDQAGAGRRGYTLAGEGADVTDPQTNQVSFHMVDANNFFIEHSSAFDLTQRYEAHTLAFEYRRGFKTGRWPRFEIGAQIQFDESDAGVLNGFISGFEDLVNRPLRSKTDPPPLGTSIARNGTSLYQTPGTGSGIGDIYLVAKAALHDGQVAAGGTQIAARVAVNVSGTSQFTEGNFVGAGVSLDRKLAARIAFHGDLRASVTLDRTSTWGLPLSRGVVGFSIGPEVRLTQNTSLSLQYDGSSSPYLPTGAIAFDAGYGDAVLGVGHRFIRARRVFVTQFYARENMVLPFSVRWNADPDLAIGLKVTIH